MDLFDAINTTRAMRRLDPDRDVSDADLLTIIEAATKAPSGGNSQPVRWMIVRDRERRRQLGAIYRECWLPIHDMYAQNEQTPDMQRVLRSADHLGDHMGDAPAIIIPCSAEAPGFGEASVYGAIQNLCLAARGVGLGTALTTVHRFREAEVRAVLGIPDNVTTWAMIPVGYPLGQWGEAKRRPVGEVTYWDTWDAVRPD
jgi:nitroreductase